MKKIVFALLVFPTLMWGQNNLIDTSTWTVGTGAVADFYRLGTDAENVRELGTDPHGNQSVLWTAVPDATSSYANGGFKVHLNMDHTKTYRFSVWIKKTNSNDGRTDFGLWAGNASNADAMLKLDGTASNEILWNGDLPSLDTWYLLVGFIHHSGYTGTTSDGGIYDPATGQKVPGITSFIDLKFASDADNLSPRALLAWDSNTSNRQYHYGPELYEVNGQEPTIAEIIDPSGSSSGGQTVWNTSGNDINYTAGNVGIATTNIGTWKLAVGGKIRAEEVKVETGWADYVFAEGYDLPTLEEVEEHINEKGHLINIPSAAEVEANGIELGEMNKLLLEKIEEQMLYILQLEKRVLKLEEQPKTQ